MKNSSIISILIFIQFSFFSYSMESLILSSNVDKSTKSSSNKISKLAQFIKLLSNYSKTKKIVELNELINVYYELNIDDQKEALLQVKKLGLSIPGISETENDFDSDNNEDDDTDYTNKSDFEDDNFYLSDDDLLNIFSKVSEKEQEQKEIGSDKKADELENLLFQIKLQEEENQKIMNQISILQELYKKTSESDNTKIEEENVKLEIEKKVIEEEIEKIKNSIVLNNRKKETEGRLVFFYKTQILALKKEIKELIEQKKKLENK